MHRKLFSTAMYYKHNTSFTHKKPKCSNRIGIYKNLAVSTKAKAIKELVSLKILSILVILSMAELTIYNLLVLNNN